MKGKFKYVDGPEIMKGDRVLITDAYDEPVSGIIAEVLQPESRIAGDYLVPSTGGIVIDTVDGESFTWTEIDSHLIFVARQRTDQR
jgi:hypothetical protein